MDEHCLDVSGHTRKHWQAQLYATREHHYHLTLSRAFCWCVLGSAFAGKSSGGGGATAGYSGTVLSPVAGGAKGDAKGFGKSPVKVKSSSGTAKHPGDDTAGGNDYGVDFSVDDSDDRGDNAGNFTGTLCVFA